VSPTRTERLVGTLRQRGWRVTTARRAVLAALVEAQGHMTADELAEKVQSSHPDVHLSTVYRTLEALEHLGLVDHTHLGHGRAVYHLADDPHQHLVCDACGAVIEVPDDTFTSLAESLQRSHGFTIRPSHFAVLGRCAACNQQWAPG
jgi:Fur family ferric uptake transcriptional regulator